MEMVHTLSEVMAMFRQELSGYYSDDEIRNMIYLATEQLLNYSKIDIHLKGHEPISIEDWEKFLQVLARLKNWEPIQYITGSAEFYRLTFQVDSRVLIPRPETEELVEWILLEERDRSSGILDIGTGSGCIAVSLAVNLPRHDLSACDVSEDALSVARLNAQTNQARVNFFRFDLLDSSAVLPSKYRVIVSNPPYVRELERAFMRKNVLDFEPKIALYVPDHDPLRYYRSIALLGRKYLEDGGMLYLEINENFAHETIRLLKSTGFYGMEIRSDLNGKPRMIRGRK
jgi:release factor glutamine methyltransferase